jgi:hypothetical protein
MNEAEKCGLSILPVSGNTGPMSLIHDRCIEASPQISPRIVDARAAMATRLSL